MNHYRVERVSHLPTTKGVALQYKHNHSLRELDLSLLMALAECMNPLTHNALSTLYCAGRSNVCGFFVRERRSVF